LHRGAARRAGRGAIIQGLAFAARMHGRRQGASSAIKFAASGPSARNFALAFARLAPPHPVRALTRRIDQSHVQHFAGPRVENDLFARAKIIAANGDDLTAAHMGQADQPHAFPPQDAPHLGDRQQGAVVTEILMKSSSPALDERLGGGRGGAQRRDSQQEQSRRGQGFLQIFHLGLICGERFANEFCRRKLRRPLDVNYA
jgi:hypothetical protein